MAWGRVAAVVAMLALMQLAPTAAVAQAPANTDLLIEATPAPGEVVSASPPTIRLVFGGPATSGPASIRVFDADGSIVPSGPVETADTIVTSTVARLPAGRYLVDWDVIVGDAGPASGAYLFSVDPSGGASIGVRRAIDGGGWPVTIGRLAALTAIAAGVGLLAASLLGRAGASDRRRLATRSAGAIAVGSVVGVALAVAVGEGSLRGLVDPGAWSAAAGGAGGWWLLALVAMAGVPYLLLRAGEEPAERTRPAWRIGAVAAVVVALAGGVGAAAASTGAGSVLAPLVVVGALAAASLTVPRLRAAGAVAAVGLIAVAVVAAANSGDDAVGERVAFDSVALEFDVAPGRVGVNEFHIYGFDTVRGGLADLQDAVAWASLPAREVGPLEIDMLRAGPNHFLTYSAELPVAGDWVIEFHTGTAASPDLQAVIVVEAR